MIYVDEHANPNEIHKALQAHENGHTLVLGYQDGSTYLEVVDTRTGAKVGKWITDEEEEAVVAAALEFDEDNEEWLS